MIMISDVIKHWQYLLYIVTKELINNYQTFFKIKKKLTYLYSLLINSLRGWPLTDI